MSTKLPLTVKTKILLLQIRYIFQSSKLLLIPTAYLSLPPKLPIFEYTLCSFEKNDNNNNTYSFFYFFKLLFKTVYCKNRASTKHPIGKNKNIVTTDPVLFSDIQNGYLHLHQIF